LEKREEGREEGKEVDVFEKRQSERPPVDYGETTLLGTCYAYIRNDNGYLKL